MSSKVKSEDLKVSPLEISLQKKKEYFDRALRSVERLIDIDVTAVVLLEHIKYINKSNYQDVVEERAISKLCGYAVCKNSLGDVPNKKYHISSTSNKVYDITERKNFCSSTCYKASKYLKAQVLDSPVWLLDGEDFSGVHLLNDGSSGLPGDEVPLVLPCVKTAEVKVAQPTFSCASNFAVSALEELQQIGGHCYNSLQIKELDIMSDTESITEFFVTKSANMTSGFEATENFSTDKDNPQISTKLSSNSDTQREETNPVVTVATENADHTDQQSNANLVESMENYSLSSRVSTSKITDEVKCGREISYSRFEAKSLLTPSDVHSKITEKSYVERVQEVMHEWFTVKSAIYLLGVEQFRVKLAETAQRLEAASQAPDWIPTIEQQIIKLAKETEDGSEIQQTESEKTCLSLLERKVKSFYQGKMTVQSEIAVEDTLRPVLPPLDKHNQRALRQKIVLQRLGKILPELVEILTIAPQDLSSETRVLTDTFQLGAHNIVLRPNDWNLMALIIIKMLSVKVKELGDALRGKRCQKRLAKMLSSFQLPAAFLNHTIDFLCQPENIAC